MAMFLSWSLKMVKQEDFDFPFLLNFFLTRQQDLFSLHQRL